MSRNLSSTLSAGIGILCLFAAEARGSELAPPSWRFPRPFTFESAMPEPLSMGLGGGVASGASGWGMALPVSVAATHGQTEESDGYLAADYFFPMLVHRPEGGDTAFFAGNLKVGFRGVSRLVFGEYPGAWSAGVDVGIPLASIWGHAGDFGPQLGQMMFPYDPVSWLSGYFGLTPKALFGIGKPICFVQASAGIPLLLAIADKEMTRTEILGNWGVAVGSRVHDLVTVTAEGGGLHSLPNRDFHGGLFAAHQFWVSLGARAFVNHLDLGLAVRVPINEVHVLGGYPRFIFLLTLGTEKRCCPGEPPGEGEDDARGENPEGVRHE